MSSTRLVRDLRNVSHDTMTVIEAYKQELRKKRRYYVSLPETLTQIVKEWQQLKDEEKNNN